VQEGHLRRVEQDHGADGSAQKAGKAHGQGEAHVLADVVAVCGDGGKLAGPQGDGVVALAWTGSIFMLSMAGKSRKEPPPATALSTPARTQPR